MDTTTRTRIPAIALLVTLIWTSGPSDHSSAARANQAPTATTQAAIEVALAPASDQTAAPAQPLTQEQRDLVDWAQSRFRQAGLDLPRVDVYFHDDVFDCQGHVGVYYRDTNSLHMCRLDKKTILHELAHAWANRALTDADRSAFLEGRGLQAWNDHSLAWDQRGTEHAAETIAWALMDRNLQVPYLPEDGSEIYYRLLTIPNSDPFGLMAAYRLLTGTDADFRDATEWQAPADTTSPEAARYDH